MPKYRVSAFLISLLVCSAKLNVRIYLKLAERLEEEVKLTVCGSILERWAPNPL
jgi:hypothetical protein